MKARSESARDRYLLIAGIAIFTLSFLLPAVRPSRADALFGWRCAALTLQSIVEERSILNAIGLINPLILLYLGLLPSEGARRARLVLTGLVFCLILVTWAYLAANGIGILIGHVLWVAGMAMILLPGLFQYVEGPPRLVRLR